MPKPDDYAVLVGIQEYPGIPVSPLAGPAKDVEYFEKWLVDPHGGNLDPTHITKLVTRNPRPNVPTEDFPPTRTEFESVIRKLTLKDGNVNKRPNGRLYLYFSGHGFSDFKEKSIHAALYTANAVPAEASNVCGTKFVQWLRRVAAFGEVILIMDCCRDEELSKEIIPPAFSDLRDPDGEKLVRVLEIYAVPYGGKAQERYFNDLNEHHGILTYALVAALYGAPLEKVRAIGNEPVRSAHSLKEFIEGCWPDLAGDNGPEAPEFVLPTKGDIAISKQPPRSVSRTIKFQPPITGTATLRVRNNDEVDTVRITMDAAAGQATIQYQGTPTQQRNSFDGTKIDLCLSPELYELILEQPGVASRDAIMPVVGDRDVAV